MPTLEALETVEPSFEESSPEQSSVNPIPQLENKNFRKPGGPGWKPGYGYKASWEDYGDIEGSMVDFDLATLRRMLVRFSKP